MTIARGGTGRLECHFLSHICTRASPGRCGIRPSCGGRDTPVGRPPWLAPEPRVTALCDRGRHGALHRPESGSGCWLPARTSRGVAAVQGSGQQHVLCADEYSWSLRFERASYVIATCRCRPIRLQSPERIYRLGDRAGHSARRRFPPTLPAPIGRRQAGARRGDRPGPITRASPQP